jgi:TetR/AcrR family fatty acid metabolism transcriptional regulator
MTAHSADRGNDRGPDRPADRAADRGNDKRERILAAAERVFARAGFFAARVSEIAREAGVADGTIYLYFKSKDDLLISLFESRMSLVNRTLGEAIAGLPPRDALHAFIRTYFQLVHDEPNAAEVVTIELRQSSKFMKEYDNPRFADFLRLLGGVIAAGQEQGAFAATIPAHIAARMLFGVLDELATAWVLAGADGTFATPAHHATAAHDVSGATAPNGAAGHATRPKKFDIVRAADWVVALVTSGLGPAPITPRPNREAAKEQP